MTDTSEKKVEEAVSAKQEGKGFWDIALSFLREGKGGDVFKSGLSGFKSKVVEYAKQIFEKVKDMFGKFVREHFAGTTIGKVLSIKDKVDNIVSGKGDLSQGKEIVGEVVDVAKDVAKKVVTGVGEEIQQRANTIKQDGIGGTFNKIKAKVSKFREMLSKPVDKSVREKMVETRAKVSEDKFNRGIDRKATGKENVGKETKGQEMNPEIVAKIAREQGR